MTTAWQIPKDLWSGETVAVLGAGPDMTAELAGRARGFKTIAVNRAVKFAPDADMFVGLDPHHPFWADPAGFAGLKVCGVECDVDALYAGMFYETVTLAPWHVIEIRNNLLAAMRIAALAGAARILLFGVDAARYDEIHAATGFFGFAAGLDQVTAELRAQGVEVERADSAKPVPKRRGK